MMSMGPESFDPGLLNDVLPVGVMIIDTGGTVRHANLRASELLEYRREELVGRSLLEFISEPDLTFLIEALAGGGRYLGQVMGPARLRFVDGRGVEKWTEYWAFGCPPEFGFEGYVVTMTIESVSDNVAQAIRQIASGEPIESSMASIARAVSAYPISAAGTIVLGAEARTVIGTWPFCDASLVADLSMPWNTVFRSGESSDLEVDELPPSLKAAACAAGIQSVWIRPVEDRRGDVGAVFLAWLDEAGAATANQARHLDEVVRVAGLAMDHHEQRTRLNAAALMDSLTGLGNRFHLSQLLTADDAPAAALYVDLDGFKSVNDTYGHNVGDVVLTLAGRRIAALVRESDAVFRMGGDEFVVIFGELPGDPGCVVDGGHTVATIAQRIVDALAEPFEVAGNDNLLIGASVGIATRQPGDSGDQLIRRSDRALLHAKSSGKSRWHQAETD